MNADATDEIKILSFDFVGTVLVLSASAERSPGLKPAKISDRECSQSSIVSVQTEIVRRVEFNPFA